MSINRLWKLIFVVTVTTLGSANGQTGSKRDSIDPDSTFAVQMIKSQTLIHSQAYNYVQELSDTIGPRLTGSPQAAAACDWAVLKLKRLGFKNAHLEKWTLGHGWQRGIASAELLMPFRLGLDITSYGWVGSTKVGGAEADVITVNSDLIPDEIKQHAKLWKGKVLFMTALGPKHLNPIRSYSQFGPFLIAAAKAQAVAVIYATGRPGTMLPHTGPPTFHDEYFPIPVVDIAQEQQQVLTRMFAAKKHVRIKIDVQNSVTRGSITCSNVVAEIPGFEHPEEVVVLGAHLDSWDLGTGSIDDGVGVGSVLAVAESLQALVAKPRRTIRFVFFTGEEEGLLGSLAYVRTHKVEMKNTVCAFVMDWGTGPITKLPLAGHDELESAFTHFTQLVGDLGQIQVDHTYLSFTDGYAFTLAGVPGIAPLQNSPNYALVGHSAADTLDKVDKKNLTDNTALLAAMSFWVANYPTRLGMPWTSQTTGKALIRDNQRTLLELFGLWNIKL